MKRLRLLGALSALAFGLVAALHFPALAQAVIAAPGQIDLDVQDQPGFQPTPEQEQLTGPWEKQVVFYRTNEPPGTIIIVTAERFLYLVQGKDRAIRYGIGVGREGFTWSGLQKISRK